MQLCLQLHPTQLPQQRNCQRLTKLPLPASQAFRHRRARLGRPPRCALSPDSLPCARLPESGVARSGGRSLSVPRPRRPRMSSTRSVWIAGMQSFTCAGDRETCPCWILRKGLLPPEGWQIDHIRPYAKGYDDRLENLRALCATCHFRVTKEALLDDEDE